MVVRKLTAEDHAAYREIRLAALTTDPHAFGSTYERAAEYDEATWRQRLTIGPDGRPAAVFLDEVEGRAVGTAGVVYMPDDSAPNLVAMWVQPDSRRTGAARRLLAAAIGWARARGDAEMLLWVAAGNDAAASLYSSVGFEYTDKAEPLASDPQNNQLEMRLSLAADGPR